MTKEQQTTGLFSVAAYLYGLERAQTHLGLLATTVDLGRYAFLLAEAWIEGRLSRSENQVVRHRSLRLIPLPGDRCRHEIVICLDGDA